MKLKPYLLIWSIILLLSPSFIWAESNKTSPKEIKIILPKVPTPVKVKVINGNDNSDILDSRKIKFSKRYPPNYVPPKEREKMGMQQKEKVGEINNGRISINLIGDYIDVQEVKKRLKSANFDILAVVSLDKKGDLISVVFTNDTLKKMASKSGREFLGTLRVLIDKKEKKMAITNPLYLSKAFLQKDFDKESAMKVLDSIKKAFPNLSNSLDKYKFQGLPSYQFMQGMPHYQDMVEIANGKNLLNKIKNNKRVVFSIGLENGSTLIGVTLSDNITKFVDKVGTINAGLLPYPIVISNGVAKILDPKYYISVMYPNLKMEEFMTIANIPDAIVKDCKKIFE